MGVTNCKRYGCEYTLRRAQRKTRGKGKKYSKAKENHMVLALRDRKSRTGGYKKSNEWRIVETTHKEEETAGESYKIRVESRRPRGVESEDGDPEGCHQKRSEQAGDISLTRTYLKTE